MCRTISKAHLFLKALQGHKEVRLQLYAQLFGMWWLGFAIDGSFGYKHAKTQDTCSDRYSHCSLHTVLHPHTHTQMLSRVQTSKHKHTHTHTNKYHRHTFCCPAAFYKHSA